MGQRYLQRSPFTHRTACGIFRTAFGLVHATEVHYLLAMEARHLYEPKCDLVARHATGWGTGRASVPATRSTTSSSNLEVYIKAASLLRLHSD